MKTIASILIFLPLWAQDTPQQPGDGVSQAAAPSQAAQAAQAPANPAPAAPANPATPTAPAASAPAAPAPPAPPATPGENWLTGSIELGYRWIPNIDGSVNTYHSVVGLGEGPRLLDADFTLTNPTKILFDRADVHASSWGGDPYNTLRVDFQKKNWYRLTADYRNLAYFDFLPSYADPSLSLGQLLDQNSFETHIRTADVQLELLPSKWITPYIGFDRNTQFGNGITDFHTDLNEYPVASLISNQTNNYRAGVRMELGRYHITLEQGGTTYKEDQGASDSFAESGNLTGLYLGQPLPLKSLTELYHVRGDSIYTKALVAANPYPWLSITGEFLYSRPRTNINYMESSTGTFYLLSLLEFYNAGQDVLAGDANAPHVTGNLTVEFHPLKRLRVVENWMTDRYHDATNALLLENFLMTGSSLSEQQLLADRLVLNTNREEVDGYYDLTSRLTLRGGYRYEWGDADVRAPILTGLPTESTNLRRNVGIAGFNYRINQKLRITGDAEGSSSGATFFRTSLQDYEKARIRARYDLSQEWRIAADFSLMNNSNPSPNIMLDYASRIESASVFYTPKAAKWSSLLVDYSRTALRSNILYLIPQLLQATPSIYRENAHSLSVVAALKWFSFGGTLYVSSGSRPTNYYQPLARLTLPVHPHVQWITEWRWYSMAEAFYAFENFQSNQVTTSLRFSR